MQMLVAVQSSCCTHCGSPPWLLHCHFTNVAALPPHSSPRRVPAPDSRDDTLPAAATMLGHSAAHFGPTAR